jgi:hypothetical protein
VPAELRRVLPIVAVAAVVLAAPAVAIAGNGGKCTASACKVYVEPGANSSGHHQSQQHQAGPSTTGEKGGKQPAPTKVDRVLAAVGKDKGALSRLLGDSSQTGVGAAPASVASPSALGAIFDLGSGPNVLLAFLIATVLGLTIYSGARSWRSRRASA